MVTPSLLFQRMTTCSNAIRHFKNEKEGNGHTSSHDEVSSYDQVVSFAHGDMVTECPTTKDVTRASMEYIKRGLRGNALDAKAQIALYISILIAYDNANNGLAKEVCDRLRGINDFDRHAMEDVFKISLCNDRVRKLLDNAIIHKTESIRPAFKHFFHTEFVEIFFNVMQIVVCREHTLAELGYMAKVTDDNMKGARVLMDKHLDDIATKCSPCFKPDTLKGKRDDNRLHPKGGGLPRVSIGRKHLEGEEATVSKLKESLVDKTEKGEFLEMMFAIVSHASNPTDPAVTYRLLTLDSVKEFFLKNVLDEAQEEDARKAILGSDEAHKLLQQVKSLEAENLSLGEKIMSLEDELEYTKDGSKSLKESLDESQRISHRFAKEISGWQEKCGERLEKIKKLERNTKIFKIKGDREIESWQNLQSRKLTSKQKEDLGWKGIFGEEEDQAVYSGDELDE